MKPCGQWGKRGSWSREAGRTVEVHDAMQGIGWRSEVPLRNAVSRWSVAGSWSHLPEAELR